MLGNIKLFLDQFDTMNIGKQDIDAVEREQMGRRAYEEESVFISRIIARFSIHRKSTFRSNRLGRPRGSSRISPLSIMLVPKLLC
jgi:hypothetical protein